MERSKLVVALLALFLFAAAGIVSSSPPVAAQGEVPEATTQYFLKIDGIPGESKDDRHHNEIDVLAFLWGESAPAPGGGGGAVIADMQDIQFTAALSKASPHLMYAVPSGRHIDEAVFTVRDTGSPVEYLKVTLQDVVVTSYNVGADGGRPVDVFTLNFRKIFYEYTPLKPNGAPDAHITAIWDRTTNSGTAP